MQRPTRWATPLLFAAALAAQQGAPPTTPAKPASPAERLEALKAEQKKAIADWQTQMKEAAAKAKEAKETKEEGKPKAMPAMMMRPDFTPLLAKAKAAAADYAGTTDAVPFLVFQLQLASKPAERAEVLDVLTDKFADDPAVVEMASIIPYLDQMTSPDQAKVYRERLAKSKNADVRGWLAFAQHQKAIEHADVGGEQFKTAKTELLAAAAAASDEQLKSQIQGAIDEREKFGVGNVAPDIAGVDLDGVAFKLSDYKGKVLFLDFWGDW